jgi:hypothetical protein
VSTPFAETLQRFLESVEEYHQQTPHLTAFSELQKAEEAEKVLSGRAAELWEAVLRTSPDDPLALHHLAIIRHGTGYRMHLRRGAECRQAIEHWRRGVQAWARLMSNDAFWARLRRTWEERHSKAKHGDMVAERLLNVDLNAFRSQVPRHLLGLHASIAEDSVRSDPELAAGHMKIILESGFEAKFIDRTRRRVYESLVKDIDALWKDKDAPEALERVRAYLRIDPNYPRALADGLHVCKLEVDKWALDGSRESVLLRMFEEAKQWAEHPVVAGASDSEVSLANARADFYTSWATVLFQMFRRAMQAKDHSRALRHVEQAFEQLQPAISVKRPTSKAREMLHVICVSGACAEINHKRDGGLRLADRLLTAALKLDPNDPDLRAVRAYYYYAKDDQAAFKRELSEAESLNARCPSDTATSLIQDLKQQAEQGESINRIKELIDRAIAAANRSSFAEALRYLKEAEGIESDIFILHFLKAQCHMLNQEPAKAAAALRRAEQLSDQAPPDMRSELANLRRVILD